MIYQSKIKKESFHCKTPSKCLLPTAHSDSKHTKVRLGPGPLFYAAVTTAMGSRFPACHRVYLVMNLKGSRTGRTQNRGNENKGLLCRSEERRPLHLTTVFSAHMRAGRVRGSKSFSLHFASFQIKSTRRQVL